MYTSVLEAKVSGRTVLVRADLNVPMADGKITNAERLERLVPGLRGLLDRGARVVLLSHFARPKGKFVPEMSLAPVAPALQTLLDRPLSFINQTVGSAVESAVAALKNGEAVLLENLRFHGGEEGNDPIFAKQLAALGDLYVNDAFSAAHRAHASTAGLANLLPAYAGELMDAELSALELALGMPERPVLAIVGGAKVSSKFDLLFNLVTKVDHLVIGGGMANTFLYAKGVGVGASLCEPELADRALEVLGRASSLGCQVFLPEDVVVAPGIDQGAKARTIALTDMGQGDMILDFGPASAAAICTLVAGAKTLIWNGPLGAFEFDPFDAATRDVAQAVAQETRAGTLQSVAGGGDTVAALAKAGVLDHLTYVSTAGGAFLEWMEGRELPGVAALG